jgi:magnesium transporter
VSEVLDAVSAREDERVRELVKPLHPADIADLFELTHGPDRPLLARALGSLLDSDVIAELNEHVREALIDTLRSGQVADIAEQLETDDAVAMIEDLEEDEQQAVLAELDPEDRAAIEDRAVLSGGIRRPPDAARADRRARAHGRSARSSIICAKMAT